MKLLIVGCGYVGLEVVRQWQQSPAEYQTVFALTRSQARADELSGLGVEPVIGDWQDPSQLAYLPAVDRVLIAAPHREDANTAVASEEFETAQWHVRGLMNTLSALPSGWRKLVYLSTTGVFSGGEGERIDEESQPNPTRIGPQMALRAEEWLEATLPPGRHTSLRLAGLYGPGRIPLAAKVLSGETLQVPAAGHLNLVHVVDVARMILQVLGRDLERSMYVFSDGNPIRRRDFYCRIAELSGVESPRFEEPPESDHRVRRATDKRVDPTRIVRETKFEYLYQDYLAGLQQALGSAEE